jgi:hypothetical protein
MTLLRFAGDRVTTVVSMIALHALPQPGARGWINP